MSDIAIRVEHVSKRYRLGQPERSSAPLQPFRCHLPSGLSQFAMFSLLPPGLSPFAIRNVSLAAFWSFTLCI